MNQEEIAVRLAQAVIQATFTPGLGTKKSPADAVRVYREVLAALRAD